MRDFCKRGALRSPGGLCRDRAPATHLLGAPPQAPGRFCGTSSPSTHQWACPAHTRGSFRFTTKGTKGVPGLRPWTPLGGIIIPPTARAVPPRKGLCRCPKPICHFEIAEEIGLIFSPRLAEVTPPAFKPWRGSRTCWPHISAGGQLGCGNELWKRRVKHFSIYYIL